MNPANKDITAKIGFLWTNKHKNIKQLAQSFNVKPQVVESMLRVYFNYHLQDYEKGYKNGYDQAMLEK